MFIGESTDEIHPGVFGLIERYAPYPWTAGGLFGKKCSGEKQGKQRPFGKYDRDTRSHSEESSNVT